MSSFYQFFVPNHREYVTETGYLTDKIKVLLNKLLSVYEYEQENGGVIN